MIRCILLIATERWASLGDKRFPDTFTPFCDIREVFEKLKSAGYIIGIITN